MPQLTPTQIVEQETSKFLDTNFGQLDLSGCPTCLTQPSDEDELPDPRFAPLDDRGVGLGAADLKNELQKMVYDPEVQAELARETGDPDVLAEIQEHQAEQVAREFRRLNPSYYRSSQNWEKLVDCLAYNLLGWEPDEGDAEEMQDELIKRGYWTLSNLTAAFKALSREGILETNPAEPRPLTQQQRRSIAIQAGSGDLEGAIGRYLQCCLPEAIAADLTNTPFLEEVYDRLADPRYKSIVEESVWFCWQFARPNYSPTPERKQFMKSYVAGRIPTAALLDEAWRACQEAERDALRAGVLNQLTEQEQEPEPDLDSLSDEEIDSLYKQVRRHSQ